VDSVDDLLRRLEQLNSIGTALSRERDISRLLESIVVAAKTITRADGGTLYRMVDDGRALRFEILRTDSLKTAMGGTSGNPINFPDLPLYTDSGANNDSLVAAYSALHKETVNIADPIRRKTLTSPVPAALTPARATAPSPFCRCP